MADLPSGEVTFLFSDIEGSTRLWETQPEAMQAALARHDAILSQAITTHSGAVFKNTAGAFYAAFADAADAVVAAIAIQRELAAAPWADITPKVRLAIHTGPAELRDGDYFSLTLNRAARLLAAAHGGQTLLTRATAELVRDYLPPELELRDLGERRLKDLARAERIYQLVTPDLPTSFPPLLTLDSRPNNLPAPPTAFIGRERELAAVTGLLRRPDVRLVTLIGPGGTGKTRLSLQVAADLLDEYDSVYFVALAATNDPDLVAVAIAQTLGVKESGQSPRASLKEYLRDRHMLLVLDNFEQVVAAAPFIADLLASAPRLKLLITSRIVLHIYGEHEYAVPPLELPATHPLPPLARLSQYAAVALFIQRAQAARPDFAVNNANAPAVAQICTLLDGLPLAIELAAARSKYLDPDQILAHLDHRLDLLTGGFRDQPDRQRTIRGAIDWSYDLLGDAERALFRRLGVFIGGWTLEAAEAVCGDFELPILDFGGDKRNEAQLATQPPKSAIQNPKLDVLEGLSALIDSSLVRPPLSPPHIQGEGQGGGDMDGESRFTRLGVIREYALEKLAESGEEEAVRRRHAEYYLALVQQAEPKLKGAQQDFWLGKLENEHDNLRAALQWSLDNDTAKAARLAEALWRFWFTHGHLSEGRMWLEAVLARSDTLAPDLHARLLNRAGILLYELGDHAPAISLFERSLAIQRRLGDKEGIVSTLNNLGLVTRFQEDYSKAEAIFQECLILRRELGDKWGEAIALSNLGTTALRIGSYDQAEGFFEQSLEIRHELGDSRGIASALNGLAEVLCSKQDFVRGCDAYRQSIVIHQSLGDRLGIAEGIEGLAEVAIITGNPAAAARLFGAAESLRANIGSRRSPSEQTVHDRSISTIRIQLGNIAFAVSWLEGRGMSLEQAVRYALEQEI